MARTLHKLTPERVKQKLKKPGTHGDGGGLYLSVKRAASKDQVAWASWLFRYASGWRESANGKRYPAGREMGLGDCESVSLATARDMAARWRSVLKAGNDPIAVRESERAAEKLAVAKGVNFKQCAELYVDSHREGWKNAKHAIQWENTLATYVYPVFGDLPVAQVDGALVHKVLDPIWKTKTETASRVRGRIESVLDWARTRGYRTGENPARWKGNLEFSYPKRSKARTVKHHAALPYADMPEFWADLSDQEGIAVAPLKFTILTAARIGEAVRAKWDEFDLDAAVWTVPAARMKGGREHRVPLSKQAVAVLREQLKLTGGQGFVFPGRNPKQPLANKGMLRLLERMGRTDITVHGFRSTFRDWAEETTNYAGAVAEAALGHIVGDKVEAAYRRGDLFEKCRKLMAAWATYCTTPAKSAKVIPMHGKAAARQHKGRYFRSVRRRSAITLWCLAPVAYRVGPLSVYEACVLVPGGSRPLSCDGRERK